MHEINQSQYRAGVNVSRRNLLKLTGSNVAVIGALSFTNGKAFAQDTLAWDKTFPKSDRVNHQKVSFYNRLGISLVGDLYVPKDLDRSRRSSAIIVGHPFGGVKEQRSGLYAQQMAERGFITLAFDASYNGQSGGHVAIAIDQTYPLSKTAQAHGNLEDCKTTGSTVLLP